MNQELRFILAITLMILVLVGTNILFPPLPPEEQPGVAGGDTLATQVDSPATVTPTPGTAVDTPSGAVPAIPGGETGAGEVSAGAVEAETARESEAPAIPTRDEAPQQPTAGETGASEEEIIVTTPLYRLTFSNYGAEITSIQLLEFESFAREGRVEILPTAEGVLGVKLRVLDQLVDLSEAPFEPSASSFTMSEESGPREVSFRYEHPDAEVNGFTYTVTYTFHPDRYLIDARAEVTGAERPLLVAELGPGIAYNEAKESEESRSMAYAVNPVQDGIRAVRHADVEDEPRVEEGPFLWTALKSKYFVLALLPGESMESEVYVGEVVAEPFPGEDFSSVRASVPFSREGTLAYRIFAGPQNFDRLTDLGEDMEDVNPYGWKIFRPVIKPFVGITMFVLTGLHNGLDVGYGWVLIIFGVAMRLLLFPLNHKAMKAQINNMAVQPLLKDIQERYKDNPERLQKEMMKLYKEHGFNPLAGCLPMLPVAIALFFVFQNTIELRGVPFLWLPSLSSPDPFYILPALLGISMFLMQYINIRVTPNPNPQMKMMMWIFPVMFTFIFLNLASGLNLYYATANLATLPQQIWIAKERAKVQPIQPPDRGD